MVRLGIRWCGSRLLNGYIGGYEGRCGLRIKGSSDAIYLGSRDMSVFAR